MSRREFLKTLGLAGAALACPGAVREACAYGLSSETPSRYEEHGWYYDLEDMKNVYEQEYNGEKKILRNIFFERKGKWIGMIDGREFELSRAFIDKTLKHFEDMIEQQTAKYLFRLDSFHCHFFVSDDDFERSYRTLDNLETSKKLVTDDNLGALFHNSEHLRDGSDKAEEKRLLTRRNVIARYDGRPLEVLPLPEGKCTAASVPGHDLAPYMKFAAHKDGAFVINADGREIRLDISFDDPAYY